MKDLNKKIGDKNMLKFALVGCGRIAKRHSELLGLNQIENASLVAVCDIIEEKAKKLGEQFNVPYYTNMDEIKHSKFIIINGW